MKRIIAMLLALAMVFALCACGDGGKKVSKELEHNRYKASWMAFGSLFSVEYHFGENGAAEKYWNRVYEDGHADTETGYGYFTIKDNKIIVSYKNDATQEKFYEDELVYKQDNNGTITLYDSLDRPYKQK